MVIDCVRLGYYCVSTFPLEKNVLYTDFIIIPPLHGDRDFYVSRMMRYEFLLKENSIRHQFNEGL